MISFSASEKNSLEIGLGQGSVEGEAISAYVLQYTYTPDPLFSALGGLVGYALGLRSTLYQADLFQASPDKNEKLEDVSVTSHNIFVQAHYINKRFQFGFNLDVLGFSNNGSFTIEGTDTEVNLRTTNVFLGGKNDKGSLNSTLFAAYHLESVIVKLGFSHSVIEFNDNGLTGDDTRQKFFDTIGVGIGYKF